MKLFKKKSLKLRDSKPPVVPTFDPIHEQVDLEFKRTKISDDLNTFSFIRTSSTAFRKHDREGMVVGKSTQLLILDGSSHL